MRGESAVQHGSTWRSVWQRARCPRGKREAKLTSCHVEFADGGVVCAQDTNGETHHELGSLLVQRATADLQACTREAFSRNLGSARKNNTNGRSLLTQAKRLNALGAVDTSVNPDRRNRRSKYHTQHTVTQPVLCCSHWCTHAARPTIELHLLGMFGKASKKK